MPKKSFTDTILNLSKFHREHEKFYAQNPLEQAQKMHYVSKVLSTLADHWSDVEAGKSPNGNPFMGCEDLNDTSTIAYAGVLFMEGEGEPMEITKIKEDLEKIAKDYREIGKWLSQAMQSSWEVARPLLKNPHLSGILGERHRIIANDWQAANLNSIVSLLCSRALNILEEVDFTPEIVRADLCGYRFYPGYLYSAKELIDRAADLATESATLVHDNERRWRVFRDQVSMMSKKPIKVGKCIAISEKGED
jgi:hypothetical protein